MKSGVQCSLPYILLCLLCSSGESFSMKTEFKPRAPDAVSALLLFLILSRPNVCRCVTMIAATDVLDESQLRLSLSLSLSLIAGRGFLLCWKVWILCFMLFRFPFFTVFGEQESERGSNYVQHAKACHLRQNQTTISRHFRLFVVCGACFHFEHSPWIVPKYSLARGIIYCLSFKIKFRMPGTRERERERNIPECL